MKIFTLHRELTVPQSPEVVWPFFSDARNLGELTPPYLGFTILSPQPIVMGEGTLIDYRIRLYGCPMRWQTEITTWEPGSRFVDEQRKGPYRLWVHEHRFEAVDRGTRLVDHVRYAMWGGALVHALAVKRSLQQIFDFREQVMRERFGGLP